LPRIVGLEAARRAIRSQGDVRLRRPARVVELLPEPSIAAGKTGHGFRELLGSVDDGQLVVVVQDAHRHSELRTKATALLEGKPDAVLVEVGLPVWQPAGVPFVATHGRGRVNLEAAAELLLSQ
jgi:beta-N-acetylhexosaminidase